MLLICNGIISIKGNFFQLNSKYLFEVFSEEDNYYYSLGQYMMSKMILDVLGGSTVAISVEVVVAEAVAASEVIIVVSLAVRSGSCIL